MSSLLKRGNSLYCALGKLPLKLWNIQGIFAANIGFVEPPLRIMDSGFKAPSKYSLGSIHFEDLLHFYLEALSPSYLQAPSQNRKPKVFPQKISSLYPFSIHIIHSHLNPIESQLLSRKKIRLGLAGKKPTHQDPPHKSVIEQLLLPA